MQLVVTVTRGFYIEKKKSVLPSPVYAICAPFSKLPRVYCDLLSVVGARDYVVD